MASKLSTPAKLPTRKIGDREVSAVGFGAMNLSVGYGPAPPDEERYKVLDYIYERGVTFWDTADCYGDNEEIIGEWFVVCYFSRYVFNRPNRLIFSWLA